NGSWDDRDFRAFFLRSGGRRRGLVHVTLDGTVRELRTVWLEDGMVKLIDQRYLPFDLRIYEAKNAEDVAVAIEDMVVRGAPAIGATAAYGMAQAGLQGLDLKAVGDRFRKTRPTGQDLFVAIDYMTKASANGTDLVAAADRYAQEDIDRCRNIGKHGAKLIRNGTRILTHCNAGALAAVDYGTVMAPMRAAKEEVLHLDGQPIARKESPARNPAFHVTPAKYITGIITEFGIRKPSQLGLLNKPATPRKKGTAKKSR